jgi:hypothetical protein
MTPPESADHQFNPQEFEEAIANLEISLKNLKNRYHQVKEDEARKEELQQREQELKVQWEKNYSREPIKSELHYLERELEELEMRLESKLFRLSSLSEPFWQAIRFAGIGVILGWILHSWAN